MVVSASGVPEEESDYSPFGTEYKITNGPNHYKFTGKERDSESDLDYFGARYYSSNMGRWLSPDPSTAVPHKPGSPQELNLYEYTVGNPMRYVDPDGRAPLDSNIVNTLANFRETVSQLMESLPKSYLGSGNMPSGASPSLQNDIKAAIIFGPKMTTGIYPTDRRYSVYLNDVEDYLVQQTTSQVTAWINNPNTTIAVLQAALVTLSGEEHQSDVPGPVGFFSDWIDRADSALKYFGLGGTRNNLVAHLEAIIEQAEKQKEEEEKKKKEKGKDCAKSGTNSSNQCPK
jgi:RHS repeat-associated protein